MRNTYIQNAMEKVGFRISTPGTGIHEVRTGASRGQITHAPSPQMP
jgi:hypothetical protein